MSRMPGLGIVWLVVAAACGLGLSVSSAKGQTPTLFRIDSIEIRDPHAFGQILFFCGDITDSP